ncbi:MAG: ferredoxin--NADP reductase [Candidatus Altimarinota bacterium]
MSQELITSYQSARIVSNVLIADHIRHIQMVPESPVMFEAGQFFLVRLRDANGDFVERSYSVANFSSGELLELVVRIEPQGQMSQLIDRLQVGDHLDIKGPYGRFGFGALPDHFERLVLIAGGVGISPLRSILQKCFQSEGSFPIQLFYGFRTPSDYLFQQELQQHAASGRLQVVPTISDASSAGWEGLTGYVTDHFEGKIFDPTPGTHSLICGPPTMVKSTREKLFSMGFDRKNVHVEAW